MWGATRRCSFQVMVAPTTGGLLEGGPVGLVACYWGGKDGNSGDEASSQVFGRLVPDFACFNRKTMFFPEYLYLYLERRYRGCVLVCL